MPPYPILPQPFPPNAFPHQQHIPTCQFDEFELFTMCADQLNWLELWPSLPPPYVWHDTIVPRMSFCRLHAWKYNGAGMFVFVLRYCTNHWTNYNYNYCGLVTGREKSSLLWSDDVMYPWLDNWGMVMYLTYEEVRFVVHPKMVDWLGY